MQDNDGGRAGGGSDREHWSQVFAAHRPRLRRLVARRLGDCDGVDDVVQETLLRAYRSRATLDTSQPIGPWLTTIALRVAADTERRARRDRATAVVLGGPSTGDDLVEALSRRAAVDTALRALSERHRRLLLATALEGVRHTVIAAHERLDPAAVRAATMRARRRFRKVYTELTEERLPAAVGAAVVRARTRMQQLESAVSTRVEAAVCMAGIAVLTMATHGPFAASQPHALRAPAHDENVHQSVASTGPGSVPPVRGPGTTSTQPPTRDLRQGDSSERRNASNHGGRRVPIPTGEARATAGRTKGAGAEIDIRVMPYGGSVFFVATIDDCDGGYTAKVLCTALDIVGPMLGTEP